MSSFKLSPEELALAESAYAASINGTDTSAHAISAAQDVGDGGDEGNQEDESDDVGSAVAAQQLDQPGEKETQRYKTLQGKFNKTVREHADLQQKVAVLEALILQQQRQQPVQEQQVVEEAPPDFSDFDQDQIARFQKLIDFRVNDALKKSGLSKDSIKSIEDSVARQSIDAFDTLLKTKIDGFDEIAESQEFIDFLNEENDLGFQNKDVLNRAFHMKNLNAVKNLVARFRAENGVPPPAKKPQPPVAPAKGKTAGVAPVDSSVRIDVSFIHKHYDRKMKGGYAGEEGQRELERNERAIQKFLQENNKPR